MRSEVCQHDSAERVYIEKDDLQELLATLLFIKHKAKFQLRIVFFQRNIRIVVLEEVLLALDAVRRTFQRRGATVNVDWCYRGHWVRGEDKFP